MRWLDSHLHLWDPEVLDYPWLHGALEARFAEDELLEERPAELEDDAAVFVQAECLPEQQLDEVRWVESIAMDAGVVAIVAGARLDRGDETRAHLDALAEIEMVVGVRHLLQGEADALVGDAAFIEGARELAARGLTFDACVWAEELPAVAALAEQVPELRIVLDHLGKPLTGDGDAPLAPTAEWRRDLRALAAHPQVHCKLSGLPAQASGHWDQDLVTPYLDAALHAFGRERLMWGSDWPVSSTASVGTQYLPGDRARWGHAVSDWAQSRRVSVDALMWDNALAFYGMR